MEFLNDLNEQQREAVINYDGPSMVIAGAGSGKTRVLTYRIAYLIKLGVDPFAILALTFTNKAAREMKSRISDIVGDTDAQNIWMGTFHSIFARILRIESDKIGYPRNFSIYDTSDSRNLLKNIIKEMGLDDKVYKPNLVHNRISSAKNNLISPQSYARNPDIVSEDTQSAKPKIAEIYAEYDQRLFKAGAMDFDDLLFKTNVLLRDFADVLHKYQHRFQYVLVDEYQDTNYAQYLIVKKLAAVHENVCVVGDDAQSIYAFRGANIQNILSFKKDYPDYKLYKLEQNYRSTQTIVNAANSVIDRNKDQIKKKVWTENDSGTLIRVIGTQSDNEEGKKISRDITETLARNNAHYKDVAILYRTNAQSRSFEESLRKLNVPYRIFGGLSFYQRKEIKDLIAYFRLTANLNDEESFRRVINYPKRGLGNTTMDRLTIAANEHQVTLWEAASDPNKFHIKLGSAARTALGKFVTMIKSFRSELDKKNGYELGQHIAAHTGLLKQLYDDRSPEGISRYENVQELLNGIKEFVDSAPEGELRTLSDFILDVALLTDADTENDGDDNKVSMMTIHSAKGLEFPYVYVVGMEENLFPSQLSIHSRPELEEERRLFYVALTRAEKRATLSYARTRYRWGNLIPCEPSRFIEEIDPSYLEQDEASAPRSGGSNWDESPWDSPFSMGQKKSAPIKKPASSKESPRVTPRNLKRMSSAAAAASNGGENERIQEGVTVQHEKFGKGKVTKLEGASPNVKAVIFFPNAGQKTLLLRFAKLEVIDE